MHDSLFASKRAYQSVLYRIAWKLTEPFGLTPARLDLLYVLRSRQPLCQRELDLALGVTPVVVSRMVKALEELGFVVRTTCAEDRRKKMVRLTDEGMERLENALDAIQGSGVMQLAYECGVGIASNGHAIGRRSLRVLGVLTKHLRWIAKTSQDRSTLRYPPSHPAAACRAPRAARAA
jgi:DNA-binding MarR family transcriptional regulator